MYAFSNFLMRCLRWLVRFRKRCGYGIHSPFAFNLVTGVIYEDSNYYVYDLLSNVHASVSDGLRMKDQKLLFRLVNNFEPRVALVLGSPSDLTLRYLHEGRRSAHWLHLDSSGDGSHKSFLVNMHDQIDFIYVNSCGLLDGFIPQLFSLSSDTSVWVIREIHKNNSMLHLWNSILSFPQVRVSFDLYDFGIVCFEQRLNKENYIINYF